VKRYLAIEITEDEAKIVAEDIIPSGPQELQLRDAPLCLRPAASPPRWASQTHTASPLFAFGSARGRRSSWIRHNTELPS
jgi:hypothetical protein